MHCSSNPVVFSPGLSDCPSVPVFKQMSFRRITFNMFIFLTRYQSNANSAPIFPPYDSVVIYVGTALNSDTLQLTFAIFWTSLGHLENCIM
ncbi:hypothetical protein ALC53_13722 [Atta colombica]|uniref:Uncharacterized protein n=1 Tax=Atta colombica TaxID=520822 RepID=A0A195AUK0_9HYME|nr:hypothetical protein ALC53_13722 [Atta colombica]